MPGGTTAQPVGVLALADRLAHHPAFELARNGDHGSRESIKQLTPIGSLDTLDLGYVDWYRQESTLVAALARERRLALSFQLRIISPFDLTMTVLGPGRIKYAAAFERATLRDVMQIYTQDETVLFLIEAHQELAGVLKAPGIARALVTRKLVRKVTDFIRACPQGMRFGIHPCLRWPLARRKSTGLMQLAPLVDWINELIDQWPPGYTLAYVHLPLAEGYAPPSTEPSWYIDLARLRVPAGVRVVLGCCHPDVTTSALRPILSMADSLCHRTVDVGASCDLALRGPRTLDDVYTVLHQQAELCTYD
jgi:hypothetical protein